MRRRTIINVEHEQLFALPQRMDHVDIQRRSRLFDLADVALVVAVRGARDGVFGEVAVEVVYYVGEDLEF